MTATIRDGINEEYIPSILLRGSNTLITQNADDLELEWLVQSQFTHVYIPIEFLSEHVFSGIFTGRIQRNSDIIYTIEWTDPYIEQIETDDLRDHAKDKLDWLTDIEPESDPRHSSINTVDNIGVKRQTAKIIVDQTDYPHTPAGVLR